MQKIYQVPIEKMAKCGSVGFFFLNALENKTS